MYLDALEFLDEEREAWRPFEALESLTDEQLSRPLESVHGWSGRDLIAHMVSWQEHALAVARELAVGESSPTHIRGDADWDSRGGDTVNAELLQTWSTLPIEEVRRRGRTVAGELRGYLTVVPESRWLKHADHLRFFLDETIDHYAEHRADLDAVLAATR
ncbi:MAG TPA: maleylpyruvate isomerase N-terminal domain-containing protein [Candidatus Limnocylindrales bacterium]